MSAWGIFCCRRLPVSGTLKGQFLVAVILVCAQLLVVIGGDSEIDLELDVLSVQVHMKIIQTGTQEGGRRAPCSFEQTA